MNKQAIQEQYQHIVNLLEQKRLKEAQVQLEAFLWNCNDWTLRNRLEQAKVSYQYMLQYMRQGVNDPERQKLYRQLLAETWELAEQTRISLLDEVSTRYYHSLHKNKKNMVAGYGMSSWLKVLESFPDDMAVCQLMPDNKQSVWTAPCNAMKALPNICSSLHGATVAGRQKKNRKPGCIWSPNCCR